MTDRLEQALADLAVEVDFPPTPDLARAVSARISERPARARPGRWSMLRAVGIAVAALLVLATVAVALGIVPGLRLTVVPSLPPASAPADPAGMRIGLGDAIALDAVEEYVPAALGGPDEAYVDDEITSLVWRPSEQLPEVGTSGVGLLLQAIEGRIDVGQVEKLVETGSQVTPVTVGEEAGFWIDGPPHVMRYLGPDGEIRAESTRLVGDVLVWQRGETLYRIETASGLQATLELAETIGP